MQVHSLQTMMKSSTIFKEKPLKINWYRIEYFCYKNNWIWIPHSVGENTSNNKTKMSRSFELHNDTNTKQTTNKYILFTSKSRKKIQKYAKQAGNKWINQSINQNEWYNKPKSNDNILSEGNPNSLHWMDGKWQWNIRNGITYTIWNKKYIYIYFDEDPLICRRKHCKCTIARWYIECVCMCSALFSPFKLNIDLLAQQGLVPFI